MGDLKEFVIGVGPDVKLGIPITSAGPPTSVDLTTVSTVTLVPMRQDGTLKPAWTATLVPAIGNVVVTPTVAIISYPFLTTDLDQKGVWRVSITLNLEDGGHWWTVPAEASFRVIDAWGRR